MGTGFGMEASGGLVIRMGMRMGKGMDTEICMVLGIRINLGRPYGGYEKLGMGMGMELEMRLGMGWKLGLAWDRHEAEQGCHEDGQKS